MLLQILRTESFVREHESLFIRMTSQKECGDTSYPAIKEAGSSTGCREAKKGCQAAEETAKRFLLWRDNILFKKTPSSFQAMTRDPPQQIGSEGLGEISSADFRTELTSPGSHSSGIEGCKELSLSFGEGIEASIPKPLRS